ncbi:phage holin family protein [Cetobacterium somerae]|nr:phage holin family protein [Cetobacterium somerae]
MYLILWLATTLDKALGVTEQRINVRCATITFVLGYEGISIHENATCVGVPVPTKLKEKLQQYKDEVFDKEK